MALIEIKNLSISLKTANGLVPICTNLDLSVNEGEIVGLIGTSGSGKSLICKAIAGIHSRNLEISFDRYRFDNIDITGKDLYQRRKFLSERVSIMLQNGTRSLDPLMTIREQLTENLPNSVRPRKIWKRFFWKKREIDILLHKVGFKDTRAILNAYPHELSEAQCQKVNIAMALGRKPRLLIADDPISTMTTLSQLQILRLIDSLNQNNHVSVIYVSNDLGSIARLMDRINMLYYGEIVEQGPTEQILKNPHHPFTQFMLDAIPDMGAGFHRKAFFKAPGGDHPDFQHPPVGCPLGNRCPYADRECNIKPPVTRVKNGFYCCHFPLNI
nr:oligopeptide/dipeptide ABC transporter ATP-binding protein [Succinimonas amylolytica]